MLKRKLTALLFLIGYFSIGLSQVAYATAIDQIIIFGDSMSDTKNIKALTTEASKAFPGVPVIPRDPPYYDGRFSNGPVWVEDLAEALNVPLVNHAYGGAWAESVNVSGILIPSLNMQVNFYLVENFTDPTRADHLFVLWVGGNDYLQGRTDIETATDSTIASIATQIEDLIYYGAEHILVLNLPDLSVLPEVREEGKEAMLEARTFSALHNKKLDNMIQQFETRFPDIQFITVDLSKPLNEIIQNPAKYNFKNVSMACYDGSYWLQGLKAHDKTMTDVALSPTSRRLSKSLQANPSLRAAYLTDKLHSMQVPPCRNPDEYFFWDHIHPTRAAHKVIARIVQEKLTAAGITGQAK